MTNKLLTIASALRDILFNDGQKKKKKGVPPFAHASFLFFFFFFCGEKGDIYGRGKCVRACMI